MAIGNSLYDEEGAKIVEDLFTKAAEKNVQLHLPSGELLSWGTGFESVRSDDRVKEIAEQLEDNIRPDLNRLIFTHD